MTLDELDDTLPNGFHDAQFQRISIDYGERCVLIELDVWVGGMQYKDLAERNRMRKGRLRINGVQFCAIEPPTPDSQFARDGSVQVDMFRADNPPAVTKSLPSDCFLGAFFVNEWNSVIYLAGKSASLEWLEEVAP
jgi:hypothetical protein